MIKPQIAIMVLTVTAALVAGIRLALGKGNLDAEGFFVNLAWSAYNLTLLWASVRAATWSGSKDTSTP